MMRNTFLTRKEMRNINSMLLEDYGCSFDLDEYYYMKTVKGDLYIISKDIQKIAYEDIIEVSAGLYVAEIRNRPRLSLEGTQLLGDKATKNFIVLTDEEWIMWIERNDIISDRFNEMNDRMYIVSNGKDYYGCGLLSGNKLKSMVPKSRSLKEAH
ncbi:MAG: hypothetical protein ACMXYL_02645 [Candidatus Woesearchaeota archaeon]